MFRRSITVWSARYGPDHYEIAVNLHNLAVCSRPAAGRRRRGRDAPRPGHQATVLGDRHHEIAALLHNLAALHVEQGLLDQAGRLFREARDLFLTTLGPDHPHPRACQAALTHPHPDAEQVQRRGSSRATGRRGLK